MGTCDNGDIIRVTAKMAWNSGVEDIQNVYHTQVNTSITPDDTTVHGGIATALDDAYDQIDAILPTGITFETIETWNVTQDRPMIEDSWPTLTAGTQTGTTAPPQCAPLCLFATSVARSQGRKYAPFPSAGNITGTGNLGSAALTAFAAFISDILDGWVAGVSSGDFGNWNSDLARFAVWISGQIQTKIRTQRRRVSGVGS